MSLDLHEAVPCDLDAGGACQLERGRLPGHDVPVVVVVRELRDQLVAVGVEHGRLGARSAQGSGARCEQRLHGVELAGTVSRGDVGRVEQLGQVDQPWHVVPGIQERVDGIGAGTVPDRALTGDVAHAGKEVGVVEVSRPALLPTCERELPLRDEVAAPAVGCRVREGAGQPGRLLGAGDQGKRGVEGVGGHVLEVREVVLERGGGQPTAVAVELRAAGEHGTSVELDVGLERVVEGHRTRFRSS